LEEAFHIVEKIGQGFYVVEANKFVITVTTWKDSKKEESMVTKYGKAKRGQKGGGQLGQVPILFSKTRARGYVLDLWRSLHE